MQTETISCQHCNHAFTIKFAVRPAGASCSKCKKRTLLQQKAEARSTGQSGKTNLATAHRLGGIDTPTAYDLKSRRRSRKLALMVAGIGTYLFLWGITWLGNSSFDRGTGPYGAFVWTPCPFAAVVCERVKIYVGQELVAKRKRTSLVVWPVFWGRNRTSERVQEIAKQWWDDARREGPRAR